MIHEISDVIASGEVSPFTGQDHSPDREISGSLIERSGKIGIHIPSEGIHLFWAVKGDCQDPICCGGGDVTH